MTMVLNPLRKPGVRAPKPKAQLPPPEAESA
jgi:hypothetical protein